MATRISKKRLSHYASIENENVDPTVTVEESVRESFA
ncbi:hypothetical protein QO002_002999 [Pararhizobium capsulatum DSM 1112]|uniref:Uncharacterized protein n=1 Tax=Pararhizobium capsulatum DSM 1112 TaxID=1121113 RepID=A0ABU0BRI4_9HYPH|nr:hypothetical protein [Pararhizobium capsulatum DSM 1112]